MGPSKGWLVADRQKRGAEDVDGFAIYVCKSGVLGRAHRSHRWGAGAERPQCGMQRGGGVLSKGASQANSAARRPLRS